jgi:2,3,4,5-tetrahydropyridine-2,6-dicarboxylate N-succinyltransferase
MTTVTTPAALHTRRDARRHARHDAPESTTGPDWSLPARLIERAWAERAQRLPDAEATEAIELVLDALDTGQLRVAVPQGPGDWAVQGWVMHAAILSFASQGKGLLRAGDLAFYDSPSRFAGMDERDWDASAWRVLPPTAVRRGVYLGKRVFLLPSFVNVGAWIGDDTMIDGFANIGTCAQIGARVHVSTGVAIGGVAEPLQARPVIVEDDCFIGAHCSLVEGVIVERGAVLGMGVHLSASTRIFDRATRSISYGRVPPGAVVVPGSLPSPCGTHHTACAVIVKTVDASTRGKIGINELLRA